MRDPRLIEIDFLMDLEREGSLTIIGNGDWNDVTSTYAGAAVRSHTRGSVRLYGTDPVRFRDMLNGLLLKGLISGVGYYAITSRLHSLRRDDALTVSGNHAGRVHLWELRDKLMRDPDLEPFGLRSRAAWDRDLFIQLRWASPETPLLVLLLDLDDFAAVNQALGHPVGDAVLRAAFQLVQGQVGTHGTVYRHGGDEIAALLPSTTLERACGLAEEIRSLIAREVRVQVGALTAPQTVSIGAASFTGLAENAAAVAKVDQLLRRAKRAGKNCIESAS
jgi:diguanylate cyclase (GGDEF)-like protein